MRFMTRALLGVVLLSVTAGLIAVAGSTVYSALQARWNEEPFQRPARERVLAVNTVTIVPGRQTPLIRAFGEIQSARRLELRAPSSGSVAELSESFRDGGAVTEGQLLLRIDPFEARNARDVARADVAEAESEARDARRALALAGDELAAAQEQAALRARALERQRDLSDRGVGSSANVEAAELALSSARAVVLSRRQAIAQAEARIDRAATALERARIALTQAERRLADTELRAPFSGTLDGVSLVEGGLVTANERLGELIDPDRLEVAFRLSAAQYARLVGSGAELRGTPVDVTLDVLGLDLAATGEVIRVGAATGEGRTGRQIFAALDAPPGYVPGDFVSVALREPPLDGVARLPATALGADGTLLLLDAENRLESVPVELLRRDGDDVIVSARGISGRQAVGERTPLLGEGILVRPLDPPANEETADAGARMLTLDPDRRARLMAFVEGSNGMPDEAKARMIEALGRDEVPETMVQRLESRMGG